MEEKSREIDKNWRIKKENEHKQKKREKRKTENSRQNREMTEKTYLMQKHEEPFFAKKINFEKNSVLVVGMWMLNWTSCKERIIEGENTFSMSENWKKIWLRISQTQTLFLNEF